jgi:aminopeptidase
MTDPRIASLARILVDYSIPVRGGDEVFITTPPSATPLVREIYRAALARGAHITVLVELPGIAPIFLEHASDEQLRHVSPVLNYVMENFDVRIAIAGLINTRELAGIDPARQALRAQAMRSVTQTFMDRSASGALRWTVTLFPTDAYAQDANMSLADFEDFVYAACLCNDPDPVASWREVGRRQQILVDWLAGKQQVHLVGPDTDLWVGIAGRSFVNCSGDRNMPDGEIFTGPEETHVNGHIRFSYPAIYQSRQVDDVRLWFEDGVVVKATARENQAFLEQMLATDEGARRLGEFAFGTNFGIRRFIKNILFDEKIGGTVHLALGGGYPETGSTNRSAIHWDLICDLREGSEVTVDGELFARDGKYVLWG